MTIKEKYLGEFEQVVLLALLQLAPEAYGANVRQLLHEKISRDVVIGALYLTLERLEKKGMVSSTSQTAIAKRGGRPRKYFKVTVKGQKALKVSRDALDTMWQGISLAPCH